MRCGICEQPVIIVKNKNKASAARRMGEDMIFFIVLARIVLVIFVPKSVRLLTVQEFH